MIVDVGAGTTDICHFYGAFPNPEDQLTLGYGGDHLDFDLRQAILDTYPEVQLSIAAARRIKERYGFVGTPTESISVQLPVRGSTPKTFDLTDILAHTCSRLAHQIVAGINELISKIDYERHENLLKGILLAGGGSQLRGLDKHIERELRHLGDVHVTRLYDSVFAGAQGALNLALRLPENCWESLLQAHA
jgi:rod shape-determining protein MreB